MPSAPSSPIRSWPVRRRFYVPYHDLDVLNHLNHAAYFPYMETLRCDYYLPLLGPPRDPTRIDIIIAEATCRYLAPVPYGAELVGEIAPAAPLGRTSFTLLYRFTLDGTETVTARGRTVVVCYDYASGAKQEIPADRRAILERDSVDPTSEGW
ncbi:MAG TPA: thioesterase family protein [Thermoplasmata archaeon]|nr:thioesterase family protein [Thermoplasmata archaeon]